MRFDKVVLFRLTQADRLLFKLAAKAKGTGLSEFIRQACRREAERVMSDGSSS